MNKKQLNIIKQFKDADVMLTLWKILYENLNEDFHVDMIHDSIVIKRKDK